MPRGRRRGHYYRNLFWGAQMPSASSRALSNSVSRQDMAVAVGLQAKSRVDQIIRELTLLDQARHAREAYQRRRRPMPEELLKQAIEQNPALDPNYPWHEDMGETSSP